MKAMWFSGTKFITAAPGTQRDTTLSSLPHLISINLHTSNLIQYDFIISPFQWALTTFTQLYDIMCACVSISAKWSSQCHSIFRSEAGRLIKSQWAFNRSPMTYHHCTTKSCWVHLLQGLSRSRGKAAKMRQVNI